MKVYQIIISYTTKQIKDKIEYNLVLYCTNPIGKTEYIAETKVLLSGYGKLLDYCVESCKNYHKKDLENIKLLTTEIRN
tara:strand:- start:167 stop:403 length:237 start_codon:yes stop_codon:yes gene_type:complete